jgi:hypothetical protein
MDVSYGIIGTVALASGLLYFKNKSQDVTYVISKVDGRKYLVKNMADKQQAADLLASVRASLVELCNKLGQKYPKREDIRRMNEKFDPDVIIENGDNKGTSYSINKGEKVVLCIRDRDEHEKLVEKNIMMFVSIHELAHIMTKSVGHTDEFWSNFKFLLKEAVGMGIYKDINFSKSPAEYCGVKITDSPLH